MKKLFFIIISIFYLNANSDLVTIKIYQKIFSNFNLNTIIIYSNDNNIKNIIVKYPNRLKITNKPEKANVLILSSKLEKEFKNKIVLVTKYKLLKELKSSIGGFYWKKGRPNIIFVKERLDRKNIHLKSEFNKYIENERCLYELCF